MTPEGSGASHKIALIVYLEPQIKDLCPLVEDATKQHLKICTPNQRP